MEEMTSSVVQNQIPKSFPFAKPYEKIAGRSAIRKC